MALAPSPVADERQWMERHGKDNSDSEHDLPTQLNRNILLPATMMVANVSHEPCDHESVATRHEADEDNGHGSW